MSVKHPSLHGRIDDVKKTINEPDYIRQSKNDLQVLLFYKQETIGRCLCVVVKRLNESGFIITTYLTDAIKEGVQIWTK